MEGLLGLVPGDVAEEDFHRRPKQESFIPALGIGVNTPIFTL